MSQPFWFGLILTVTGLSFLLGMGGIHVSLQQMRREHGRLTRRALASQRLLAWLPLGWLAILGAMLLRARTYVGHWPSARRTFPPRWLGEGVLPAVPDPHEFPLLQWLLLTLTFGAFTSWIAYVPLCAHAHRARQTPIAAGLGAYLVLHVAWWTHLFLDPGEFVSWALD